MNALKLTADGIVRALTAATRPTIDRAVRARADRLAAAIEDRGVDARVIRRGDADCVVVASGNGLFAREFGGVGRAPDRVIAPAVAASRGEGD